MTELSVAGRQLPLVFDLCSWAQIEEEVCRLQDMHLLLGRGKKTEDAQAGLKEKLDSSSIINLSHPDYDRQRDLLVADIMALFPVPESDMKSKRLSTLIKLVRILGNEGLELSGKKPDLTDKWLMRALPPSRLLECEIAVNDEIAKGMSMEIPEEDKQPRDLTLEELEKKKRQALTSRDVTAYALIAGLSYTEALRLRPGMILEIFYRRKKYDALFKVHL